MSLNGLDDARVKEAHETAVAEPGGWFLLKYAARDEVELLGRGNGGIVEIRNNIAQYTEKSPLYGFLRYRRRNVIIKYLPEDCSRLIQARVTVHFNAVCDRFSPSDTTFSIADAKELKDTKLSAACSLHAASGSTSSSTSSLRRRRLMEITEEEEEEERERKRQSVVKEEERPKTPTASEPPVKLDANLARSPEASRFANENEPPHFMGVPRPSSPATSFDDASRPHRPVATVPAGLKSASKGSKKGRSRSHSQDDEGQEPPIQEQAEESSPHTPAEGHEAKEKKKMLSLQPALEAPASEIPSAPSTPGLPDEKQDPEVAEGTLQEEEATADEGDAQEVDPLSASNVDSGIDVGTDQASVDTQTDSLPASPLATSEIGDSTQASSLSDSTDETVLAKDEHPELEVEAESADIKPAASSPSETFPASEVVDGAEPGTHDRQSQATIVAEAKDGGAEEESPVAVSSKTEQNAAALGGPAEASPEILASPEKLEEGASEANPTETAEAAVPASSTLEPKPTEVDPHQEGKLPSPQFRIPLSKFSTQETKSPTSGVAPSVPSIVAHTSDVDSWRVGDSAPPVPEKDSDVGGGETPEATEATGIEPRRRILPGPIRTDLDAPDNDKRRSVISILDNDGFMDELQSATVQQATPITVSKSPISPFFALDQAAKRPAGPESTASAPRFVRTVSNPVRNSFLAPGETSASPVRSASSGAAYLQKISQQSTSDVRPKSSKLGSSISQRIKALEKLSGSSPGGDASHAAPKERPASTFFAVRKAGTREPSRSPSVVDRAGSVNGGPSPSPPGSRESSPEALKVMGRGRSDSLVNRLSMFEGGMPPRGRPESVQVRARIIRDPNQPFPKAPESKGGSAEYSPLDLKQSPLVVDVQNRVDSRSPVRPSSVLSVRTLERDIATQAKQSLLERRLSKQSQDGERDVTKSEASDGLRPRRRSSLSFVKGFIKDRTESIIGTKSPSTDNLGNALSSAAASQASPAISRPPSRASSIHQAGSLARRLSISSRRSSIDQNSPALSSAVLPTPRMADGADLGAEAKSSSSADEKKSGFGSSGPASPNQSKGSRASRFMRRLSNSLVTSRKNSAPSISPTVAEEDAADVEAASRASTAAGSAAQSQPSIVAFMGDVNVQFPDNLLWKRRSICLDNQGFLILSAVQGSAMMHPAPGKDRHGAMVKRYHMSDFKPPYAPDVELQELPNSVVLDLVDGSGLQIACEDRAGQMSILRILEEAHHNHTSFGH
ncbi:hypothetical protein NEMBOFW57_000757 [Staphylotrichum longicolle]|uniref:ADF-H domain-containing protein n=1 Tax=Staphylotrichum longicolle TaxID=669026 RepID=A0AAD4F0S8_9PEZI|nr:hypothetical protein NEMBOFW57_000757 [Staphylotrichum longicolle]